MIKGAAYGTTFCKKHQEKFIDFKCRYCCSVALFFCFGTHHFCDPCHKKAYELRKKAEKDLKQCKGKDKCPLKIDHPPNGKEYALGCGLCRELKHNAEPADDKDEKMVDF
jgi:E3 ubiquitin-protein ligase MYCBP2